METADEAGTPTPAPATPRETPTAEETLMLAGALLYSIGNGERGLAGDRR